MTHKLWIGIAIILASSTNVSIAQVPLSTPEQKFSYAMGVRVATQLQQKLGLAGTQLDTSTFIQGIQDVLTGAQSQLSREEIQSVLQIQQTQQYMMKQASVGITNKRTGDSFRKANRAKDGVIETASGLQYRVLAEGTGVQPTLNNSVVMHYLGRHVNGDEFANTYESGTPETFNLNEVIAGWQEVLQLMQEGAKWELVMPPELAYGDIGSDNVGPNETLIFEIELISVE